MMHKAVHLALFCNPRSKRSRQLDTGPQPQGISPLHSTVALLMIMILGSWAMDSWRIPFVPDNMAARLSKIDNVFMQRCSESDDLACCVFTAMANNPIDNSPFTFGSVILLGLICATGLGLSRRSAYSQRRYC